MADEINLQMVDDGEINLQMVDDGEINLTLNSAYSKFRHLTDTPNSYSGQAGKLVRVNSGETGVEFYTLVETDPVFSASPAGTITNEMISHWNAAYGYGNHALAGYLTSFTELDPVWTAEKVNYYTKSQINAIVGNFITGIEWSEITGSISDNSALQNTLNLKADLSALNEHIEDTDNPHQVTKAQLGLDNVNNTADINKPISSVTQAALDQKVDKVSGKGLSANDFTTIEKNKLSNLKIRSRVNFTGLQASGSDGSQNRVLIVPGSQDISIAEVYQDGLLLTPTTHYTSNNLNRTITIKNNLWNEQNISVFYNE